MQYWGMWMREECMTSCQGKRSMCFYLETWIDFQQTLYPFEFFESPDTVSVLWTIPLPMRSHFEPRLITPFFRTPGSHNIARNRTRITVNEDYSQHLRDRFHHTQRATNQYRRKHSTATVRAGEREGERERERKIERERCILILKCNFWHILFHIFRDD